MAPEKPQLSPALSGKFECVGVVPGRINTPSHGTVDLTTIGLTTAEELIAGRNFPYLRRIETPPSSTTSERGAAKAKAE